MLKKLTTAIIRTSTLLWLVALPVMAQQDDTKTDKKPDLTVVQVKVVDKKTGSAIDNADVLVKWVKGSESDSSSATTTDNGTAKIKDVPRGKVVIRVIAHGYTAVAPSFDLKKEDQPIKIELDKETEHPDDKDASPTVSNSSTRPIDY